jgi:hypothetical protein
LHTIGVTLRTQNHELPYCFALPHVMKSTAGA